MNQSTVATTVAIITGVFALLGLPGITSQDVEGFMKVASGLISLAGIGWAHFAHKDELGRALAGKR